VSESVPFVPASLVEPVPAVDVVISVVGTLASLVGAVDASVVVTAVELSEPELELPASAVAEVLSSPHPARSEASVRRPAREGLRMRKRSMGESGSSDRATRR
jgi:hypothetical protein